MTYISYYQLSQSPWEKINIKLIYLFSIEICFHEITSVTKKFPSLYVVHQFHTNDRNRMHPAQFQGAASCQISGSVFLGDTSRQKKPSPSEGWATRRCVRLGVSRPRSRELAPSQADWLELASFLAAASRRLPGHDLASTRLLVRLVRYCARESFYTTTFLQIFSICARALDGLLLQSSSTENVTRWDIFHKVLKTV